MEIADLNPVGGLGGAPLQFDVIQRLMFGGGGGAGHENNSTGSGGGSGGGVVFIRAASLSGMGSISADGANGPDCPPPGFDGSGGGGAGGTLYLRIVGVASCTLVSAQGGNGGSPMDIDGPGGGGGGGRILFQQAGVPASCPTSVLSGVSGLQPPGIPFGATPQIHDDPQFAGIELTSLGGFVVPPPPVLTAPAEGMVLPPSFLGPMQGTALADATVIISVDGIEVGKTLSNPAGTWSWNLPSALALGLHQIEASQELLGVRSLPSPPRSISFLLPVPPRAFRVAWGCQAVNASEFTPAWLLLLIPAKVRRRR
jgi:hypothetical protein